MKPRIIINILVAFILVPVSLFYLWGVSVITLIAFKSANPEYPINFIPMGLGLIALWIFSFKYKAYATANKIPLVIIICLVCGAASSIYLLNGIENILLIYLYGSPIIILTMLIYQFYKERENKNA